MKNFKESKYVKEVSNVTSNMYRQGWDERNGGNISYLLDEDKVREFFPTDKFLRDIELGFTADEVCRNKYFLVTGTGKYFKNVKIIVNLNCQKFLLKLFDDTAQMVSIPL